MMQRLGLILAAFLASPAAMAVGAVTAGGRSDTNWTAITIFIAFVASTLGITWWAARQVKSRQDFLVASGGITPLQNGMAIAGDFMSAATFLGITGALYFRGVDAFVLAIGIMVGWPIMLMLIAERFRNLGRFTFIDVVSFRLDKKPLRLMASLVSLSIVLFYLIAQMVGAGTLVQLLFGLDYGVAVVLVGVLMVIYVAFGGMVATTWVQLIKAALLLLGGTWLAALLLATSDFSVAALFARSRETPGAPDAFLVPGGWFGGDPVAVITTALTMAFGVMGLPHVLMRFFTVKDAAAARQSVFYATSIMGYFYILILIIGLGSLSVLAGHADYADAGGVLIGGANMVAIHLSHALGGDLMLGFMAAVSFATILAVVAGLTLSGAATVAQDLYASLSDHASEERTMGVSRIATLVIGVVAVILGFVFEGQNVAVTAAFALAVAASVNFPIIIMAMYWKGLTTRGAVAGGLIGLVVAVVLILLSPGVMVDVLGKPAAIFPYTYPTIIAMPLTFLVILVVSWLDRSDRAGTDRALFEAQRQRSELGTGIESASDH
ncbi:sodium:solute symporter family transporter [Yunchengibacter salinarum]|uniref:sodium:solute symporter family transporter n=1 Tax=Yunchengibacter salinarum TaxID=3133399 RepID=UPI0035B62264